jgi:hypothetical protein
MRFASTIYGPFNDGALGTGRCQSSDRTPDSTRICGDPNGCLRLQYEAELTDVSAALDPASCLAYFRIELL